MSESSASASDDLQRLVWEFPLARLSVPRTEVFGDERLPNPRVFMPRIFDGLWSR